MGTEARGQKSESGQRLKKTAFCFLSSVLCLLTSVFCSLSSDAADNKAPLQFTKKQELQQVKPKKPVRIKLHRNGNGEYTWDLTGDSVDEIVRADARLKKLLQLK